MQARNALLAAYYVLDEDGVLGLSEEQVVGVLTAEPAIGVNRGQAEQLWQMLAREDPANSASKVYRRSFSAPIYTLPPESIANPRQFLAATAHAAAEAAAADGGSAAPMFSPSLSRTPNARPGTREESGDDDNIDKSKTSNNITDGDASRSSSSSERTATARKIAANKVAAENKAEVRAARAARAAERAPWLSVACGLRVDVHGFLRLADLLHQRVKVDDVTEARGTAFVVAGSRDGEISREISGLGRGVGVRGGKKGGGEGYGGMGVRSNGGNGGNGVGHGGSSVNYGGGVRGSQEGRAAGGSEATDAMERDSFGCNYTGNDASVPPRFRNSHGVGAQDVANGFRRGGRRTASWVVRMVKDTVQAAGNATRPLRGTATGTAKEVVSRRWFASAAQVREYRLASLCVGVLSRRKGHDVVRSATCAD